MFNHGSGAENAQHTGGQTMAGVPQWEPDIFKFLDEYLKR
jgi:hypothetical protein